MVFLPIPKLHGFLNTMVWVPVLKPKPVSCLSWGTMVYSYNKYHSVVIKNPNDFHGIFLHHVVFL